MFLILDVGSNMKWMMKINIFLITFNKILDTNHIYGYLKQPLSQNVLKGNNISYF